MSITVLQSIHLKLSQPRLSSLAVSSTLASYQISPFEPPWQWFWKPYMLTPIRTCSSLVSKHFFISKVACQSGRDFVKSFSSYVGSKLQKSGLLPPTLCVIVCEPEQIQGQVTRTETVMQ